MQETSRDIRLLVEEQKEKDSGTADRQKNLSRAVDYFSAESFREGQREAIEGIDNAFRQGYKYVILSAPTGIGKSHIALTFARQASSCHILTVQKMLQDQYARDFGDEVAIMKGRGSYRCIYEQGKSCAEGPCKRKKVQVHENCPYRLALDKAASSKITVHNFDSFYFQSTFAHRFFQRDLLIVDEAHSIENKYLNFLSFIVSNKFNRALQIKEYATVEQYDSFLSEQLQALNTRLTILEEQFELTGEQLKELEDTKNLKDKLERYFISKRLNYISHYVVDFQDNGMWQSVTFRPVLVGDFVKSSLFSKGRRVLMMSATIFSKKIFCESVSLNPNEVEFIEIDSAFPVENRPVFRKYAGSMSYKYINETLPKMVYRIKEILNKYPNHRGIIQTHSEKVAKYIQQNLFDNRLTFRKDFKTVEEMLEVHKKKKNSFIVASGLKEGLDLYDSLSRIQIIAKVPYPDLSDKRIQVRKELNKSWYGYTTVLMFVQSIGRSVRSRTDKAVTYILDSGFEQFYKFNKRFIPKYIREAIK